METEGLRLARLCEQFCAEQFHRPRTARHYRQLTTIFRRDTGIEFVADISRESALAWRTLALNERQIRPATWNNYVRHMRALMNYAIRSGHSALAVNPFHRLIISQPIKKKRTVCPDAWNKIIAFLKENEAAGLQDPKKDLFAASWFWLILLNTSDKTGIRLRQIVALQWRDLDFRRKTVHLRAESSKTNREWDIPMHESIEHQLLLLRERTIQRLGKYAPEAQVFNVNLFSSRHRQTSLTDHQVCQFCQRVYQLTGYRISPHRLRHTLATDLMQKPDRDLPTVRDLLGHTSIRTTLEYVRPDVERMRSLLNTHRGNPAGV